MKVKQSTQKKAKRDAKVDLKEKRRRKKVDNNIMMTQKKEKSEYSQCGKLIIMTMMMVMR